MHEEYSVNRDGLSEKCKRKHDKKQTEATSKIIIIVMLFYGGEQTSGSIQYVAS